MYFEKIIRTHLLRLDVIREPCIQLPWTRLSKLRELLFESTGLTYRHSSGNIKNNGWGKLKVGATEALNYKIFMKNKRTEDGLRFNPCFVLSSVIKIFYKRADYKIDINNTDRILLGYMKTSLKSSKESVTNKVILSWRRV